VKGFILILAGLVMLGQPTAGVCKADSPAELIGAIRQLSDLDGFSCRFRQIITFSDGSSHEFYGTLAILPPNRFRWQYTKPFEQLIVSNGKKIWHYEPDLMQVRILTGLEDVDPVVMQLLAGRIGIDKLEVLDSDLPARRYHISIKGGATAWLGLTSEGSIAYIETLDALGNSNRIELNDWILRSPAKAQFVFHLPDGVDVVAQ